MNLKHANKFFKFRICTFEGMCNATLITTAFNIRLVVNFHEENAIELHYANHYAPTMCGKNR